MATPDPVTRFVRDALSAGRARADIEKALSSAGWSEREISDALAAYAEVDFVPPVPRPRPQLTARDAFVYAILFTALGFAASFLVSLIHGLIDVSITDAADNRYLRARMSDQMRLAIAMLVVSGPVYVWMSIYTARQIARDQGQRRSLVRKWLTYLALFIAALVFLGDATTVIYRFLDGELTLRFSLKALTVGLVSAGVFFYYLGDAEEMKDAR